MNLISGIAAPTTPAQFADLAEAIERSFEFAQNERVVKAANKAAKLGWELLRDTRPGSSDRITVVNALGVVEYAQAAALWGAGRRGESRKAYTLAGTLMEEGRNPAGVLAVVAEQISCEVLSYRPVSGTRMASEARDYASRAGLTSHPNYARVLVVGEVRALVAAGQFDRADDCLGEAVDVMAGAPPADHVGVHHTGMSSAEFAVCLASRYNELADADGRETYAADDRSRAREYAATAQHDLDKAGATGLRSYARIEIARTLTGEDPAVAADILLDVVDISRYRPTAGLFDRYRTAGKAIAEKNAELGAMLARALDGWCDPAGTSRRSAE